MDNGKEKTLHSENRKNLPVVKSLFIMLSTFNGEAYLEEQLNSIYLQKTDCRIHLLVRDDGSKDSTRSILEKWRNRLNIQMLYDEQSLGAARSFWKLLQCVPDADYYAFVDQDDIWDSDKIETALKAMEMDSGPLLWCSNCRIIDKTGKIVKQQMQEKEPIMTIPSQLVCGSVQGCAMVFNMAAKDLVLRKNPQIIPMHDIILMLYLLAGGKVIYENRPLFSYRIHEYNTVAKEGKTWIQKLKSTTRLWFGRENRNAISALANQILLDDREELSYEVYRYLEELGACPHSILKRLRVIVNPLSITHHKRGLRSFRIRTLLGVI